LEVRDDVCFAFPRWLQQSISAAWPERWRQILGACNQRPPMSLRVNVRRTRREQYSARLAAEGLAAEPLRYAPEGLLLERPVDVQRLAGFADGLASVQDGGAQLAAGLLQPEPGQRVLDACAAPGGKTSHILETAPELAELVAVDLDVHRLERVRENLRRLGLRATVAQGDAAAPAGAWATPAGYQRILLDVPCSATGVIRRHPDIKLLRRADDIPRLVYQQARMLEAVWPLLAPGGILVYATCSLLPQENEQQVKAFLARHSDAGELPIRADWGHPRDVGRQILPGEHSMDGFYYARLERR
jgi:16S rRNA (cytosine967-C5)-methyltransferase